VAVNYRICYRIYYTLPENLEQLMVEIEAATKELAVRKFIETVAVGTECTITQIVRTIRSQHALRVH